MNCCSATDQKNVGTERYFSKQSRKYLKQFQRRGLSKEQLYLLEGITAVPIGQKTIIDIGCGVGGVHLSLLQKGAQSATGVEISEGMLEGAKTLSKRLGFEDRTNYIQGDFTETNGTISPADITILDKVVCCYPNMDLLLNKSIEKTRVLYALSFPRPSAFVEALFFIPIAMGRLLHWSFYPHWHDWNSLLQSIREHGFTPLYHKDTFIWSVYVFQRTDRSP